MYVSTLILSLFLLMEILPTEQNNLYYYRNTLVSSILLFIIIFTKQHIQNKIKNLRSSIVDVKLYTIMISNLSQDINLNEIKSYFENLTKYKVEKVNMAYDINEYKEAVKQKINLIEKLRNLQTSPELTDT